MEPRRSCRVNSSDHCLAFERAERIGEFWSYPQSRTFAELLELSDMRPRTDMTGSSRAGLLLVRRVGHRGWSGSFGRV